MALFLHHKKRTFQLAVWKMDETVEELLEQLPDREYYINAIQRFSTESRRREWLSVRMLIFALLGEDKKIDYETDGKPFLSDHSHSISLSHTKGYVAVILSEHTIVGIDIEQYGLRIERIASRFMRADEQANAYAGDPIWGMLLHWSAKETLFKSFKDASADLRLMRLAHFTPEASGVLRIQEYWTEKQQVFAISYLLFPDFVLTWLVE